MSLEYPPLKQIWPEECVARYREAGYWRGDTFPGFLRQRAREFAGDVAVIGGNTRLTYAQLWDEAERIGAGFLASGLKPGDRVIVQLGNIPEFITVVCALFRAQLIPVYALPAHRKTEISHFARKSGAKAYVIGEKYEGFDYRTLARDLQAEIPAVEHVYVVGNAEEFTALDTLDGLRDQLPGDPGPQSVQAAVPDCPN